MKKYEITDKTKSVNGVKVHQIRALTDIATAHGGHIVYKDELGGWIEKEENLSQDGTCWIKSGSVIGDAHVCDDAMVDVNSVVSDDAVISGKALVCNSKIYSSAKVYDNACVYSCLMGGDAQVYGNAQVYQATIGGCAKIFGDADIKLTGKMPIDREAVAWKKEHFFTRQNLTFTRDASGQIYVTRCFSYGFTSQRLDLFEAFCEKKTGVTYRQYLQYIAEAKQYIDTTPYTPEIEEQAAERKEDNDFTTTVICALEKSGYRVIRPAEANDGMTINEYQKLAQRTSPDDHDKLLNGCMGLSGETGEACDVLKKSMFQGHPLDRGHMIEELGDCAWYLAEAASGLGVSLQDILLQNIAKLKRRYSQGFDPERSVHREA